ncbi:MAG: hypothetical protein EBS53_09070, partial [Bacteroidetes bacterium]|nr:hypothetical protein [Bacteroidota bacterium]
LQGTFAVGAEIHGSEGPRIDPDFLDKNSQQVPRTDWLPIPLQNFQLGTGVKQNSFRRHRKIKTLILHFSSSVVLLGSASLR